MKKNQAILILISIFIVSAALGVGGTWVVKSIGTSNIIAVNGPVVVPGGGDNVSDSPNHSEEQVSPPTPKPAPTKEYTPQKKGTAPNNHESREKEPLEVNTENGDSKYDKPLGERTETNMPISDITLVSVNGPTPNPETRTYSFTATASGGWGQYTYYLYPAKNAKDTLVSTSGSFASVAPIASGKYVLLIKDRTGKEFTKEIKGFTTILKKLTIQQLTARLSKATPDQGLGQHFASGCRINFSGVKRGDPVPTSYTQIYSNIASGYWSQVKVTAVEFNDYNKITRITISVYY